MSHKSEDYKIYAVKYYLKSNNYAKTCNIFECSERSLKRWVERYNQQNNIKRNSRQSISYKIKNKHIDYAKELLKKDKHLTMEALAKKIKEKYNNFNITPQHLGKVIRDNNITRKRTKTMHYPKTRYGVETNLKEDLSKFYKEVDKYSLDKIICLDETSIAPYMMPEYSYCPLGRRCVIPTDDNFIFRKYTLLVAISMNGLVGAKIYEKGGMTKERFVYFIDQFIKDKYKKHLIILDNAGSHYNEIVKNKIFQTDNKYLYSIPYQPKTNSIENFFSQLKHYLKLNKPSSSFSQIKTNIENAYKEKENAKI
jgi:transposase